MGRGGTASDRDARSIGLPLVATIGAGALAAVAITSGQALLVPLSLVAAGVALIVTRHPFAAVLIWLLVFPWAGGTSAAGYWMFHRLLIPGTLLFVITQRMVSGRVPHVSIFAGEWAMPLFLVLAIANIGALDSGAEDAFVHLYDHIIVPFTMYWLIRILQPDRDDLRRLAAVAAVAILAQAAVGVISWLAPSVLPSAWRVYEGTRTVGTLGTVGAYSIALIVCTVLVLDRRFLTRGFVARGTLSALAALGAVFVFLSFSRSSWLALLALGVFLAFRWPRSSVMYGVPLAVATILVGVLLFRDAGTFLGDRLQSEETALDRVTVYTAALQMIRDRPLTGWGYQQFDEFVDPFRERLGDIPVLALTTSHHAFLTLGVELGIFAVILYGVPIVYWLYRSIRHGRRLPSTGPLSGRLLFLLWGALLFQLIVSNFIDTVRFVPVATMMFWLTLGLIASLLTRLGSRDHPPHSVAQARGPGWTRAQA